MSVYEVGGFEGLLLREVDFGGRRQILEGWCRVGRIRWDKADFNVIVGGKSILVSNSGDSRFWLAYLEKVDLTMFIDFHSVMGSCISYSKLANLFISI